MNFGEQIAGRSTFGTGIVFYIGVSTGCRMIVRKTNATDESVLRPI